jgi:cytochrome b561
MSVTRSHVTRFLHLALLLIVLHQLASSLFMERPLPGDDPEGLFLTHQWLGAAGLGVVTLFWVWTLARHASETPFGALIPWLSVRRLMALARDLRAVAQSFAAWRAPGPLDALASAVHGLGLITASGLAASGVAWMLFFQGTHMGRLVLTAHSLLGNLMWAYVVGHAGMGVLHQFAGEDVFSRMFWFPPRRVSSPAE